MPPIPFLYGRVGSMAGADFGKSAHLVMNGSGYDRPLHQLARLTRPDKYGKLGVLSSNVISSIVPPALGPISSSSIGSMGMRALQNPSAAMIAKNISKLF